MMWTILVHTYLQLFAIAENRVSGITVLEIIAAERHSAIFLMNTHHDFCAVPLSIPSFASCPQSQYSMWCELYSSVSIGFELTSYNASRRWQLSNGIYTFVSGGTFCLGVYLYIWFTFYEIFYTFCFNIAFHFLYFLSYSNSIHEWFCGYTKQYNKTISQKTFWFQILGNASFTVDTFFFIRQVQCWK